MYESIHEGDVFDGLRLFRMYLPEAGPGAPLDVSVAAVTEFEAFFGVFRPAFFLVFRFCFFLLWRVAGFPFLVIRFFPMRCLS
ncbi:MAG: hypothetical protein LBS70_05340 [Candidatus Accumulibacter sp.]|nr:hypothetical protein [Accumulibacter sp.]